MQPKWIQEISRFNEVKNFFLLIFRVRLVDESMLSDRYEKAKIKNSKMFTKWYNYKRINWRKK
jgi:hypothetical protein